MKRFYISNTSGNTALSLVKRGVDLQTGGSKVEDNSDKIDYLASLVGELYQVLLDADITTHEEVLEQSKVIHAKVVSD